MNFGGDSAQHFGGDSAQHFDEEAFYDDEYEDEELSANELSAASSSSTMPLSSKAVPNRAEEIAAQLRCQDPKTGKSCFAVATTDSDIKALLRTRQIKHLEASESEDELFDDDENEEIVYTNKASDNNATDATPNKSRMELINSGLHELTQNNGRSVLSAVSKPRQSRFIKNTQEPETPPKEAKLCLSFRGISVRQAASVLQLRASLVTNQMLRVMQGVERAD